MNNHIEGTNNMTHCPFCQVDFVARKWTLCQEQEAHFQDHIDQRYERIMADEAISKSTDWESQDVKQAFVRRDQNYLDPAVKIRKLQEDTVSLTEETYRLTRENQRLRQAAQGFGTGSPETGSRQQQQQRRTQPRPQSQPTVVAPSTTTTDTPVPTRKNLLAPAIAPPAARRRPIPDPQPQPQPEAMESRSTAGSPAIPAPSQQPTPGSAAPAQTRAWTQTQTQTPAQTPIRAPARGPTNTGRVGGDGTYIFTEISDSDDDNYIDDAPISRPSSSGIRRNRASNVASVIDPPYRPDRRSPDDDDDDGYQQGLVPEPRPDLDITMKITPPTPSAPAARKTPQSMARVQDQSSFLGVPPPAAGPRLGVSGKRLTPTTGSPSKRPRTSSEQTSGGRAPSTSGTSGTTSSQSTRRSPVRPDAGAPSTAGITADTAGPALSRRSPLRQVAQADEEEL